MQRAGVWDDCTEASIAEFFKRELLSDESREGEMYRAAVEKYGEDFTDYFDDAFRTISDRIMLLKTV